ncbi:MAG: NifU family protein [Microscillaceae bacterium]|jgi:Fe-S cluster biogenesis protein NfuA|nr:NifU family protein [Microscillaceae bacterium]
MNPTQERYITIYTEASPNPNSLKFALNFMLLPEGTTFDFPDAAHAAESPLATELFTYEFVRRVFVMSNFITVTKADEADWHDIAPTLKNHIKAYLEAGKPLLSAKIMETYDAQLNQDEPEVNRKIKQILDEYVRPAVEGDGGAINFHSFENGVVKVLLQGSCSGCPSSTLTLKAGIENLLKRMIPEVSEVVAEGM